MLRWTEGAKPGNVVKRKHTADDVIEQKRSYEGHRNRGFQGHWKNGLTWLTFENEKMFCTYCRDVCFFWTRKIMFGLVKPSTSLARRTSG